MRAERVNLSTQMDQFLNLGLCLGDNNSTSEATKPGQLKNKKITRKKSQVLKICLVLLCSWETSMQNRRQNVRNFYVLNTYKSINQIN